MALLALIVAAVAGGVFLLLASHAAVPIFRVASSTMSVARVYADVNSKRPEEYWDYEALQVQWG